MENLKRQLEVAETPEAQREIVWAWRRQSEAWWAESVPPGPKGNERSSREVLAERKAWAADDPEIARRAAQLEQLLDAAESLKEAAEKIGDLEGGEKRLLFERFLQERERFAQVRKSEMEARQEESEFRESMNAAGPVSIEEQALKAETEARKQELEDLVAAMEEAPPERRRELIGAWRRKQESGRADHVLRLEKGEGL